MRIVFASALLLTLSLAATAHDQPKTTTRQAPKKAAAARPASPKAPVATRRISPVVVAPASRVLATAATVAPSLVTYSGVVLGPNALALPGACVFVAGDHSRMAVTNAKGEFVLALPASASGYLQVSYAGLAESQLPLETMNRTALYVTMNRK